MKDLNKCREEIDEIDEQLIALFEKRMQTVKDVITYKIENNMEIFQPDREKKVVEKNIDRLRNKNLASYAELFIQEMQVLFLKEQ